MKLNFSKKLNLLLSSLVLTALGGSIYLSTDLFTNDLTGLMKKDLLDISSLITKRIHSEIDSALSAGQLFGALSFENFESKESKIKFLSSQFNPQKKWKAFRLIHLTNEGARTLWSAGEIEGLKDLKTDLSDYKSNDILIRHFQTSNQLSYFKAIVPLVKSSSGNFSHYYEIYLSQDSLIKILKDSGNFKSTILLDDGSVLASSDPNEIIGKKLDLPPQSGSLFESKNSNQGYRLGSVQDIGLGDLRLITETSDQQIKTAKAKLYRRTSLLTLGFFFLSLLIGLIFSKSFTTPIELLSQASQKIRNGNFNIKLKNNIKVHPKTGELIGDEIQALTHTFNQMAQGLAEREKMRQMVEKFHQKEIVDKVLSGELQLGGERKNAVVFFSDLRGFTELSERLAPEAVVQVLNRYLETMVGIIIKHKGVVDKYVGDAIMAVWGIPENTNDDIENALHACIEMREALVKLNQELSKTGNIQLKMGMGLHYGPVIAGTIGSSQRMEFTVIGDTVNTAARVESATKEQQTDLLVTSLIAQKAEGLGFGFSETPVSLELKGKASRVLAYKVIKEFHVPEISEKMKTDTKIKALKRSAA